MMYLRPLISAIVPWGADFVIMLFLGCSEALKSSAGNQSAVNGFLTSVTTYTHGRGKRFGDDTKNTHSLSVPKSSETIPRQICFVF